MLYSLGGNEVRRVVRVLQPVYQKRITGNAPFAHFVTTQRPLNVRCAMFEKEHLPENQG